MSGFACIVARRGQRVPSRTVDLVAESLRHRGPDGVTTDVAGGVALVHAALHSTPEAARERQPLRHASGVTYVGDVRLDNRSDLIPALGWRRAPSDTTDIELVAEAHQRWGHALGDRIIGDFAFAAVTRSGTIEVFRDHMGIRPVHYWCSPDWFVVASEIRQIVAVPGTPSEIDIAVAGEYLSGQVESATDTVLAGIHRLPAAHLLRYEDRVRTERYWLPELDEPILLPCRDDYRERFRELFDQAVHCRLRTTGPIGCELSGGLDSTSVAAAAARSHDVRAFSCRFPGAPRSDETAFIKEAVDELGFQWEAVVNDPDRPRWVDDNVSFWSDIPLPPDGPEHVEIANRTRDLGGRVLLTGHGGDHWLDASSYILTELLSTGQIGPAWQTAIAWASGDRRGAIELVARTQFTHMKPAWLTKPGNRRARWVTGEARAAARLDERRLPGQLPLLFGGRRANALHRINDTGYEAMTRLILDRSGSQAGIETRHPYLDRRLMEFACRVPAAVHHEPGRNRTLQRDILDDLLPTLIINRRSKASFSEVWWQEIRRHTTPRQLADGKLASLGWLDPAEVSAAWERTAAIMDASTGAGHAIALWGMIQIESVLRQLDGLHCAPA